MKVDFRKYEDDSPIGTILLAIKDKFFNQMTFEEDMKELKTAFCEELKDSDKGQLYYTLCIQSLIYLVAHMNHLPKIYETLAVNFLVNELEKNFRGEDIEIWQDGKFEHNIFHALSLSDYDHAEIQPHLFNLFKEFLPSMLLQQNSDGFTPLNTACKKGKVQEAIALANMAKNILSFKDYNILLTLPNYFGFTPFRSAFHSAELLKFLYLEIPNQDINEGYESFTNLYNACKEGKTDSVKWLLSYRANYLEQSPKSELSPLQVAINYGHLNIVTIILEYMRPPIVQKCLNFQHAQGTILTMARDRKNYPAIDKILEIAIKNFHLDEFISYTQGIYWGDDEKALTNLLYQAKINLNPEDYFIFMNQRSPLRKTLLELCEDKKSPIAGRIQKYIKEKLPESEWCKLGIASKLTKEFSHQDSPYTLFSRRDPSYSQDKPKSLENDSSTLGGKRI